MLKFFVSIFCFVFLFISCSSSDFEQALDYQNSGDYEKALEFYNKAISKKQNSALAEKKKGDIFFSQKNFSSAFECYKNSMEQDSKFSMDQMFKLLSDGNKEIRTMARNMLIEIQNETTIQNILKRLTNLLKSDKQFEKLDALELISAFGNKSKPIINDIIELIDDDNITVKQKMFSILPTITDIAVPAGAIEKLFGLLKHSNDTIKSGAIECIGNMKQINDYSPLIEVVKTKPALKQIVINTINKLDPPSKEAAETVKRFLNDENSQAKLLALSVFKKMGDNASAFIPSIIPLLEGTNSTVSKETKSILSSIKTTDPTIIPELINLLDSKSKIVKLEAIRWLANASSDANNAIPKLQKLAEDGDKEIKSSAILALKQIRK